MARLTKGLTVGSVRTSYEEVMSELIVEQNEMQLIIMDLLYAIAETHPEITLKYAGYADKITKMNNVINS